MAGQIDIELLVGTETLLGRRQGELHLPALLTSVLRNPVGVVVHLDFHDIQNITASWIAAAVVPLLKMRSSGSLGQYLLLTRIAPDLTDEFEYVLSHENTPAILSDDEGKLVVLGALDPVYAKTLEQVLKYGRVTAKGLLSSNKDQIGLTAWIKRLSTLNAIGLIRKEKAGREYFYEPLLEVKNG